MSDKHFVTSCEERIADAVVAERKRTEQEIAAWLLNVFVAEKDADVLLLASNQIESGDYRTQVGGR